MKLKQIMNNFHSVDVREGITVYFSYETAIAIELPDQIIVSENEWSRTTGKHINWCKRKREEFKQVPHRDLLSIIDLETN